MATLTNASFAQIASLAYLAAAVPFTYIAVGTGTTAESAAHTALVTETTTSGLGRADATTKTRSTTTQTNDTTSLSETFTVTGSVTVAEVGVFNASSAGTMWFRHKLGTAKSLINGDSYTVTCTCQFTA